MPIQDASLQRIADKANSRRNLLPLSITIVSCIPSTQLKAAGVSQAYLFFLEHVPLGLVAGDSSTNGVLQFSVVAQLVQPFRFATP
jgi:hypothetical protein